MKVKTKEIGTTKNTKGHEDLKSKRQNLSIGLSPMIFEMLIRFGVF